MKNFKISRKLMVSFLIVILLAVIVGGVGILGM
jgi:CHASE3 domain sensor protein